MSKTMATRYDVAEHLRTPEEMAAYLEAAIAEANGDAAFIAKALGDIVRAKGMAQVARDAGLSRQSLYQALSGERSPDLDTVLKVVAALGLELHAGTARDSPPRPTTVFGPRWPPLAAPAVLPSPWAGSKSVRGRRISRRRPPAAP